ALRSRDADRGRRRAARRAGTESGDDCGAAAAACRPARRVTRAALSAAPSLTSPRRSVPRGAVQRARGAFPAADRPGNRLSQGRGMRLQRLVAGVSALAAGVTLAACQRQRSGEGTMAAVNNMPGMSGMPGMAAPGADSGGVPVDRTDAARLGVTFARAAVRAGVRAVGILNYAEPRRVYVSVRVSGWVEKLYADYVGKPVAAGEPLLALYAPELVSAQEEYLLARRLQDDTLAASARRRLVLWDIPADQIDSLEARGTVERTLLLRAPRSGQIVEKDVIEGQAVQAGMNLFQIADPSVLWVDLAIFEQDAAAVPGRTFRGRVSFIYPELDPKTRTLTARVEVENPRLELRPGMYAAAEL